VTDEERRPRDGMTPRDVAKPPARARASGPEERPSLRASLTSIRVLAGSLAEVPSQIKTAPARAVVPKRDGMPQWDPGPLRRVLRAATWPLMVTSVSGGLAVLALALTDALP